MAQIDSNTVAASPDATGPIASRQQTRVLSICLINPRFEPSFWGFDYSLPLYPRNKRSYIAPGALPLLAALAGRHDVYVDIGGLSSGSNASALYELIPRIENLRPVDAHRHRHRRHARRMPDRAPFAAYDCSSPFR